MFADTVGPYFGGEGGIRTPDTVARTPHFECGAFNHSATSPRHERLADRLAAAKVRAGDQHPVAAASLAPAAGHRQRVTALVAGRATPSAAWPYRK